MADTAAAQDHTWKSKEQGEEARYVREKEHAQIAAIHAQQDGTRNTDTSAERDFEGGFGGQEDLEDRYATTSGEH